MNNEELINFLSMGIDALRSYHNHKVVGLDHIPKRGRALLVCNHSLATYDITLLFGAIFEKLNRLPRPLADHLFFKIPQIGMMIEALGASEGTSDNAAQMLEQEQLVAVAPGGMREALRPSNEKYKILWQKRQGFVRLAIETQTPILLAMCPKSDDLYDIYENAITKWAYKNLKVPIPIAKGIGLSPIPKPIVLTHVVSKPIMPPIPSRSKAGLTRQVNNLHKKIIKKAEETIESALELI